MATRPEDVRAIFESAVDIESCAERAAYLGRRCAADAELRRQVESLLVAHVQAGDFLARPAVEALTPDDPDAGPSLPADSSVLAALADNLRVVPHVQLRQPMTEPVTPVNLPDSPEMPQVPAPGAPRLQLLGEIARGGMGAILKGRDVDLGRDVAVKVLLENYRDRTEIAQRFIEEAQIAGQLQHPGVVPVYQLGVFADRRPYFTMKFVKGQTLAALLAARQNPADDQPRYVGIFAQVCQTLAYAHARGVIHRDLKPSNVMVGAYGEVQVMDWGLAKVLREGGVADEERARSQQEISVIHTARSGSTGAPEDGSDTQAGTLLGTPAYMSPEQARGDVDLIDERADVFGLGGLLCEILTGQPPFAGKNAEAARRARQSRLDDALTRLDDCGADGELVALAKRCLAPEPWDRPRDAGEVVKQVTAYQNAVAQRLRQAELARAAEQARAEEAQATAAQERKARQAAQAREVEERKRRRTQLALAASLLALVGLGAAGGLWVQHQSAQRRAERVRREDDQRRAVDFAVAKAAELRQQMHWREAQVVLTQAQQMLGDDGPANLRQQMDAAQSDLTLVSRLDNIRQSHTSFVDGRFDYQKADQEYAAAFRESGLGEVGDDEETVAARVRASAVSGVLVTALDDWALLTRTRKIRLWLFGVARRADPDSRVQRFRDLDVWQDRQKLRQLARDVLRDDAAKLKELSPSVLDLLANCLAKGAERIPLLRAAQRQYPRDFWLNIDLATALRAAKQYEQAVGYLRVAVALRPDASVAHEHLGSALVDTKNLEEAVTECRQAVALDAGSPKAHLNLGRALYATGDVAGATAAYRKALELNPRYAKAHNNLGAVLFDDKNLDGAIAAFRQAIALDRRDTLARLNLGKALRAKGDLGGAKAEFRAVIDMEPRNADAHYCLGDVLYVQHDVAGSIAEFHTAVALDRTNAEFAFSLARALSDGKRDVAGAIAAYRRAIELAPNNAQAHCDLGFLLRRQGKFAESLEELRRGHELGSRNPRWKNRSEPWVRAAEELLHLNAELPRFLRGDAQPASPREAIGLARVCQFTQLYAAAARFFGHAFAVPPAWTPAQYAVNRYNAACCAALAGCGQGKDADKLDDKERGRLRQQARGWLRDALALWTKQAAGDKPGERAQVRQVLRRWQTDADLAGLRDKEALAKLPADERAACEQLWADVAAVVRKIEEKDK